MSRTKLIFSAIGLMVITAVMTVGIYTWALTGDAYGALRLWVGMKIVSTQYVDPVKSDQLMNGAIQGMVKSLGDPYSSYMDEKTLSAFMAETKGSFSGVGIVLGMKDNQLSVIAPIEGTPGERAGVKPGDFIRKIDGEETKNFSLEDAVNRIRGAEGTSVVLTLERASKENPDTTETLEVTLVRENIKIKTVSGKMLEGDVGYVRLTSFSETSSADFSAKLTELDQQGMKKLVLDLRNNPGGLLHTSVEIAGMLLKEGEVVSVINRSGQKEISRSGGPNDRYESLVVLINGGSASASEILAGAIQDRHEGTLVGTKSFGKGSVQLLYPLDLEQKTAVKLTIAKYYTPSGRSIHGTGLEPDIQIEWTGDGPAGEVATDLQLKKALEIIQSKPTNPPAQ
ncbi:MAG: S41 family peptidase [Negativicutes bacterium]|nr:S41 family peptidase [Negativicutes bacterium]